MVNLILGISLIDNALYELVGHLVIATGLGISYFYTKNKIIGIASLFFLLFFFIRLGFVLFY